MQSSVINDKRKRPARANMKSLSKGRPPTARRPHAVVSHKATNTVINTYHALNKDLARARREGDHDKASSIESQLQSLGGLETYQRASIQGQEERRGGDSSAVLVEWLRPSLKSNGIGRKPRLLEIGALSTKNACSRSKLFDVTRIDLNSQGEGIAQQDFMQRPLPLADTVETSSLGHDVDEERFEVISLSLVLNFVPDLTQRGEMLRRTTKFFTSAPLPENELLPCLFLVLPASCVTNARYMNAARLENIMTSLGYYMLERKQSPRLVYYLWRWDSSRVDESRQNFAKVLLKDGKKRNNFSIVLRPDNT